MFWLIPTVGSCKQFCFESCYTRSLGNMMRISRNLFLAAHKVFTSSTSPKRSNYLPNVYIHTTSSNVYLFHSFHIPLKFGFLDISKFWMWNVIPFDFNLHFPIFNEVKHLWAYKMVSYCLFSINLLLFIQHDGYIYLPFMFLFFCELVFLCSCFTFFLLIGKFFLVSLGVLQICHWLVFSLIYADFW